MCVRGSLISIDVVRHFLSSDSFKLNFHTGDSNCSKNREYVRLLDGAGAEPLPEYTDFDVLCGAGKGNYRIGNQDYRRLVEARVTEYNIATNARKNELAMEVINLVIERGNRFYAKDKQGYTEITDKGTLREKVKSAFRGQLKNI